MDKNSVESYTGIHSLPKSATSILDDLESYEEHQVPIEYLENEQRPNSVMDSWLRVFDKAGILQYEEDFIYK
jgi:hypothetical protein